MPRGTCGIYSGYKRHLSVAARVVDDQQPAGGVHQFAGARMSDERGAMHRGGANHALEGDLYRVVNAGMLPREGESEDIRLV